MKAILISIKPKWVHKILQGGKTIEIRKTCPKCELPIDVYIYCTKDKEPCFVGIPRSGKYTILNGKVVAKFTLKEIRLAKYQPYVDETSKMANKLTCLTDEELDKYLNKKDGYGWVIDDLEIFDEPKELWEFETTKQHLVGVIGQTQPILQNDRLSKAPQSWCYIEGE